MPGACFSSITPTGPTAHNDIETIMNTAADNDANRVLIFDTTLRDGEQSPGASMNLTEKMEIARTLEALDRKSVV